MYTTRGGWECDSAAHVKKKILSPGKWLEFFVCETRVQRGQGLVAAFVHHNHHTGGRRGESGGQIECFDSARVGRGDLAGGAAPEGGRIEGH